MKKLLTAFFIAAFAMSMWAQTSVTFRANMSVQMKKGNFNATDVIYVKGSFNGWGSGNPLTKSPTDSIFSATISTDIKAGDTLYFKFQFTHNGSDVWENDPNRQFIVKEGANTFTAYFNNDSIYNPTKKVVVSWNCNMEYEIVSKRFVPGKDTLSVNGDFNGWTSKKSLLKPNPLNPNIYIGKDTVNVALTDTIKFKFWYTPNNWESLSDRKEGFSTAEYNAGAKTFSASFNNASLANIINQDCKIKFTVNTKNAKSRYTNGAFPAIKTVHVAGAVLPLVWPGDGWPSADITKIIKLYDDGTNGDLKANDGIFSADVTFSKYTVLSAIYKYSINYGDSLNNGGGNDNENAAEINHTLIMTPKMSAATIVDTFGVAKVSNLVNISAGPATVTFKANMSVQMKKGNFSAADPIYVKGSFNGWGSGNPLTKSPTDSTFSTTITTDIKAYDTLYYKFQFTHNGSDVWENDPNRQYIVKEGDNVVTAYFNNDSIYNPTKKVVVSWNCNMEYEIVSKRFVPGKDTLSVNGDFNGWTSKKSLLKPNPLNPNNYIGKDTVNVALTDTIKFKFWYTPNNWESLSDRKAGFSTSEYNTGAKTFTATFNDASLANIINQDCKIKFTVNTKNAKSRYTNAAFPAIKTVHVAGAVLPLVWPGDGWPSADITKIIKLYDDGTNGDVTAGDGIYSADVLFGKYTVLSAIYKYSINYGDSLNNGGGNDNENAAEINHTLVMTPKMSAATVVDTFGVAKVSSLVNITGVQVDELPGLPLTYALDQNYPNPFNPSTTINFSIPAAGKVSLKIYDMLGKEVMTLVNSDKNAGKYSVSFNASKLSSGVYFYTIKSNNFTSTKKMILMK